MLTAGLWWMPVLILVGPLLGALAFALRHWRDVVRLVHDVREIERNAARDDMQW